MINDVKVFAYRRQATACTEWMYEEKRKSPQEGLFSSARAGKANLGASSRDIGTGGWSLPGGMPSDLCRITSNLRGLGVMP